MRRTAFIVTTTLLLVVGLLVTPSSRTTVLIGVGQLLVADEWAVDHVDVAVVAVDAGVAGLMEAADLTRNGVTARTAAFTALPGRLEEELIARGVPIVHKEALYRQQLSALGVLDVIPIPRVIGTADQGRVLPAWCDEHGWSSVAIVTSWHHSLRVTRIINRAMKGHPTKVHIRVARHSDFDPDSWWQDRNGARTVLVEIQKLLIDYVQHPFS